MSDSRAFILHADDDEDDRFLIRQAVEMLGLPVVVHGVASGAELEAYLSNGGRKPDVVLLDLNMNPGTGFDVLRRRREIPHLAHTPILVLTTSSQEGDIARAYDLGAAAFLCKPAEMHDLMRMMQALVDFWVTTVRRAA